MNAADSLTKVPGVLRLGGQEFVILPPTPRDMIATNARMRELAKAECVSPLDYVLSHAHLPADALAFAVGEAIKVGAGGGIKPTMDAVAEQYTSLAGARWRVWYHISRVIKDFTPKDVEPLVTADNVFDALEALDDALNFKAIDPEKKTPSTGSGS